MTWTPLATQEEHRPGQASDPRVYQPSKYLTNQILLTSFIFISIIFQDG